MVLLVAARPSKVTSHLRSTRTLAVGETQLERAEVGSERAVARSEAAEGKVGRAAAGWPRASSTGGRKPSIHSTCRSAAQRRFSLSRLFGRPGAFVRPRVWPRPHSHGRRYAIAHGAGWLPWMVSRGAAYSPISNFKLNFIPTRLYCMYGARKIPRVRLPQQGPHQLRVESRRVCRIVCEHCSALMVALIAPSRVFHRTTY